MIESVPNLMQFEEHVGRVRDDEYSERFVRTMLKRVALSCPLHVLSQLGEKLAEIRRLELEQEAA